MKQSHSRAERREPYLNVVRLNIVRTSVIIYSPQIMTSKGEYTVIETRNMSAETSLQTVLGNTHNREGGGVSFNARRSRFLFSELY